MFALLATRRFGPLFAAQFLGAFNDNLFKTAMLFLITFHLAVDAGRAALLVTAAAGVFVVPFFLFSGLAGQIADARDKAAVARLVKLAEIAILGVGALALASGSVPLLFAVLFGLGVHSTVFGPVKYAILPQHLKAHELLAGTGLVEGGTFVAILLGQIAGGLLPTGIVGVTMLAVAALGALAARGIPPAPPATPGTAIDWNPITATTRIVRGAFGVRQVALATVAISWFWAIGAVFTSEFVPLVRGELDAGEGVATLFLAVFTVGIALGSAAVSRLLGGRVSARAAAPAAAAMALASLDLLVSVGGASALPAEVAGFAACPADAAGFAACPAAWRLLADLFVLAAAGGVFSVPLYAILQTASGPATRASAVAANNIVNAAFQVGGVVLAGIAVATGVPLTVVLASTGASIVLTIPFLRRL